MLARTAVEAVGRQHTAVPGEQAAARLVQALALVLLDLDRKIAELDEDIAKAFRAHPHAEIVTSMPGIGPLLGAEFLAATSGDMGLFGSADRLATYAGLAPAPHDSGRVSGNLHRPTRYHRGLQRVFYMSAMSSIHFCPESRRFYQRKRAEGKRHTQAVLALARRRVNVSLGPTAGRTPLRTRTTRRKLSLTSPLGSLPSCLNTAQLTRSSTLFELHRPHERM
ncbi:transposase [Streptomyces sp. 4N124]|uniref:transposase n=1 Tax=Streptomyces sp. 4N124 TaxID=3457420 RepID=UPI003FD2902C